MTDKLIKWLKNINWKAECGCICKDCPIDGELMVEKLIYELELMQMDSDTIKIDLLNGIVYRIEGIYDGSEIQDIIEKELGKLRG